MFRHGSERYLFLGWSAELSYIEQINVSRPTLLLLLTLTTLTTLGFVTTIQQHWDLITTLGVWDPPPGPHNPTLSGGTLVRSSCGWRYPHPHPSAAQVDATGKRRATTPPPAKPQAETRPVNARGQPLAGGEAHGRPRRARKRETLLVDGRSGLTR